mmetsp:Transcript_54510/g.127376  ORF Transcript_54510/g.127376 Transcript_54510/m.127376 type:complete len:203 (-) Transcript_54510:424-1032(-)
MRNSRTSTLPVWSPSMLLNSSTSTKCRCLWKTFKTTAKSGRLRGSSPGTARIAASKRPGSGCACPSAFSALFARCLGIPDSVPSALYTSCTRDSLHSCWTCISKFFSLNSRDPESCILSTSRFSSSSTTMALPRLNLSALPRLKPKPKLADDLRAAASALRRRRCMAASFFRAFWSKCCGMFSSWKLGGLYVCFRCGRIIRN